jgi:hypothetical protein
MNQYGGIILAKAGPISSLALSIRLWRVHKRMPLDVGIKLQTPKALISGDSRISKIEIILNL